MMLEHVAQISRKATTKWMKKNCNISQPYLQLYIGPAQKTRRWCSLYWTLQKKWEKVGKSGSYGYDGGPRESVTSKEAKGSSRGGCSELSTS